LATVLAIDGANTDLWLIDLKRGTSTRLTSDPGEEALARWSSDPTRIVYHADRLGTRAIVLKSLRSGGDELLYRSSNPWTQVWDWSRDGRYVVFREIDTATGWDLWILPTFGERKPFPYLNTRFEEGFGTVAPAGTWMAYVSDESGQREVYVQAFPTPRDKHQVSVDGGFLPIWSRDGRELFYLQPSGRMMSVAIRADAASIDVGAPRILFTSTTERLSRFRGVDVAPDGRFLIALETGEGVSRVPALILNWPQLIKKR
jgi:Tol biopolymer transport system component